jgi:O-antigen ligase
VSALFVFTIPLGIKFHDIAVILFLVLCIVAINWKELLNSKWREKPLPILNILQVIIIALGLLHSTNLEAGLNDMERAIYPIVILPIIYLMISTGKSVYKLLYFFSISCIGVALYGFVSSWIALDTISFAEVVYNGHLNFDLHTGIQPLYLSVYLILVLFYLLESIRTKYDTLDALSKWGLAGISLLVIGIVVFLRSKTALLLMPALLVIYLVILLKKRGWLVVFILMMVGLLTFLLDRNNFLDLLDEYGAVSKAFDQRLYIWRGAIEGIKISPWIGSGTGGTQELLNAGYAVIGYQEGIVNEFNAHNQYLQFMARNGLLELLCFLAILGYSFYKSAKQSNYTFLMFNMLVSLVMLTESFLSVQKGIAFFYFFLLAFIYLPEKKQEQTQI